PFHVLVLGNTTGTHFVYDNRYVSIGGLIDGNSILNLLDWLESSPLAERISSFHLAGVSLGGHAILAAALYESFRPARKIPVRSYLVQSPVVDIEASFKR